MGIGTFCRFSSSFLRATCHKYKNAGVLAKTRIALPISTFTMITCLVSIADFGLLKFESYSNSNWYDDSWNLFFINNKFFLLWLIWPCHETFCFWWGWWTQLETSYRKFRCIAIDFWEPRVKMRDCLFRLCKCTHSYLLWMYVTQVWMGTTAV